MLNQSFAFREKWVRIYLVVQYESSEPFNGLFRTLREAREAASADHNVRDLFAVDVDMSDGFELARRLTGPTGGRDAHGLGVPVYRHHVVRAHSGVRFVPVDVDEVLDPFEGRCTCQLCE